MSVGKYIQLGQPVICQQLIVTWKRTYAGERRRLKDKDSPAPSTRQTAEMPVAEQISRITSKH